RSAVGGPAQRCRRDRGGGSRRRPARRPRARALGTGFRRGRRAPRRTRRVLEGAVVRVADALRDGFGAVAEFKRRAPWAGDLRPGGDVVAVARAYEANGARAMSVLVDERFAGTWDDLRAARASTTLPLLAKGFFSTPEHLRTARESGADAALLILRDLDD